MDFIKFQKFARNPDNMLHASRPETGGAGGEKDGYSWDEHWNPDGMSLGRLKKYLCMGLESECLKTGQCECLDACRFGQRAVALKKENKK